MGSTRIEQPAPVQQPSVQSSMQDYISSYPALVNLTEQYSPREANLALGLMQQYGLPMASEYKKIQDTLYPETAQLTEKLSSTALGGMNSEVPDWMRNEYLSNMQSLMGNNAGSPIASDYVSRGLLQQKKDWQSYYENLGLSLSNKIPLAQGQQPSYTNQLQGYTPNSVLGYNSNIFGTQAGMYNTRYNAYAQNANQSPAWQNALGSIGGSIAGGLGSGFGLATGAALMI